MPPDLEIQGDMSGARADEHSSSSTDVSDHTAAAGKPPEKEKGDSRDGENERILVEWEENDAENPFNWTRWKKIRVLGIISLGSTCVTCASSIVASAYDGIEKDLGVSKEVAILGLSLFVLGLGSGPCLLAPFSEFYGRRPIYIISYGAFFLLNFPVAFANHISIFLIFRFLTGFAGSAFLSVAGGTVSDMWQPSESLLPMAFYTCTPFLGPVSGPLIGGFIASFSEWRYCFYVIIIWSFLGWLALLLGAPETFTPTLLTIRARQLRKSTGDDKYYAQHEEDLQDKSLTKTVSISATRVFLLLALEPMLFLLCLWCALLLGILYLSFELYPIVFGKHNFLPYQNGLTFIGIGLGIIISLGSMPIWVRRFKRAAELNGGVAPPEARLDMAKAGAFLAPAGLFIFAFTSYQKITWIAPVIGSIPFGTGFIYIFVSVFAYTVVEWRPVAASAMGANSVLRSLFAAGMPLFLIPMANRLTTTGTAALLAGLLCLMIPIPFVFTRYGEQLRAKSKFIK